MKSIEEIARREIKIQAIICDVRKGLVKLFYIKTPVQMCNFHQVATVRRHLTKKPKMQASKELWVHALLLKQTDNESFEGGLQAWFIKCQDFLNDRKTHEMGRKDTYYEVHIGALGQIFPGSLPNMRMLNGKYLTRSMLSMAIFRCKA